MLIYAIPPSLYCAKLRIVLRAKGLAWREEPPPGGYGSAEYKRVVPSGNLPALVEDGFLLADGEAIAEYLEERFPEPALMPVDLRERARMRERGRFHDTRLEPAVRRLFPHIEREGRDAGVVRQAVVEIEARLGQFARMVGDDLPFGLGDCGWPITLLWIELLGPVMGFSVTLPAEVAAYRDRLADVPWVAAELAAYRPAVEAFLASER
ncbi:glutathione S-transferase family protein [Seohaeicola nanhaiensis]|uniref:Glutathione S-transferase family protein n=1 Tax=Seohaeicola nanhaiensis TaxID=1387282 RepID=A0ABV9KJC3_9RHOB